MSEMRKGLGSRIRAIRKNLRLNQRAFGDLLGVGVSAVSAYEAGQSIPSPESLVFIAKKGQESLDYLLTGEESRSHVAVESGLEDDVVVKVQQEEEPLDAQVSHQDISFELSKEEFTLLSLFSRLPDEKQKERLLELAYLVSLEEKHRA